MIGVLFFFVQAQEDLLLELQDRLKETNANLYKTQDANQALQERVLYAEVST